MQELRLYFHLGLEVEIISVKLLGVYISNLLLQTTCISAAVKAAENLDSSSQPTFLLGHH